MNSKKVLAWILGLVVIIGVVVGGYFLFFNGGESSGTFTLKVTLDNGSTVVVDEEITPEENMSLMDAMKENCEIEESDGLITSINGNAQDFEKNIYWFYTINGEFASVGAGEYYPQDGDLIEFDLHEWVDDSASTGDETASEENSVYETATESMPLEETETAA